MKVKLKNVLPNPFRDIDAYPILQSKIENLKKSISSTGFWDNIVARQTPDGKKIEIAYGHHRVEALRAMYPDTKEFDFIIKDFDDAQMIRSMADENMQEWGHDSGIERETVKAIVEAYGAGKINLTKPAGNTPTDSFRYAPSFCFGKQRVAGTRSDSHEVKPYTADTICGFLNGTMSVDTVKYTLRALCLIEQGHLKESQLKGLTSSQAREVVNETAATIKRAETIRKEAERQAMSAPTPTLQRQIVREAEKKADQIVKRTATVVSSALQSGKTKSEAKSAALDARIQIEGKTERELPEINNAASSVASQLYRLLDPEYQPGSKLEELIKFKKHLSPTSLRSLDGALQAVIEYAEGYRVRLK